MNRGARSVAGRWLFVAAMVAGTLATATLIGLVSQR